MDNMNNNANYINSVVASQTVACPNCGTANKIGGKFCIFCGFELTAKAPVSEPAPVQPNPPANPFGSAPVEQPKAAPVEPKPAPVQPNPPVNPFGSAPVEQPKAAPVEPKPAPVQPNPPVNPFGSAPVEQHKAAPVEPKPTPVQPKPVAVPEEPKPAFASGLPSWDIVPPNTPVRRHRH